MTKINSLPPYMNILFNRLYANKIVSGVCDDERIVKLCHLGQKKKIMKDLLRDVAKNAHVLQIGLTFGDELEQIYDKVKKNKEVSLEEFDEILNYFRKNGCEIIILGCTELSVVYSYLKIRYNDIVDSLTVLAKKTVEVSGKKLKEL